ncbi:protein-tyrosine phosphatase-like protein [Pilobolus umbonatus]|nr:protein-tyrosine phosphatase-like protein [Pilobolus umbonatus]
MAVHWFGFITRWKWYNKIDDTIILGALPTPSLIRKLHKEDHVDTIVNMCSEFPGYEMLYSILDIHQIRIKTSDFTVPSIDSIQTGIDEINRVKREHPNTMIYLHCKAGRGRSAALALCYLFYTYSLDIDEAQSILLKKRPQVSTFQCLYSPV